MNDMPRLEQKSWCDASITSRATTDRVASTLELWTCGREDRAANSGSFLQFGIRRVDDRVDILRDDISLHDLNTIPKIHFFRHSGGLARQVNRVGGGEHTLVQISFRYVGRLGGRLSC